MKLQLGVMAHQNTPTTQSLVVTSQYWTQLLGFAYIYARASEDSGKSNSAPVYTNAAIIQIHV
jgi:hypothetical protein